MRILVSIENDKSLELIKLKLLNFFSVIEDKEVFIDLFHVHQPIEYRRSLGQEETLSQIKEEEYRVKLNFIAKCENEIEEYLVGKLQKESLVNSIIKKGDYKEILKEQIIFHSYDLLILTPDHKNNFTTILQGRNTHWVIDNLEIPVLLLPSHLELAEKADMEILCFNDDETTYANICKSDLMQRIKTDHVKHLHFGRKVIHPNVETKHSSNVFESITDFTKQSSLDKIFVLNHKNKGDYLNFLDKSFTKTVIKNLHNPLLIF